MLLIRLISSEGEDTAMQTKQEVVGDKAHEHDHAPLVQAHKGREEVEERQQHDSAAHVHDHSAPTGAGR
jgi:hypothetical protein